jgi:hypothetical protein
MQIGFLITLGLIFLVVWLFTSFILYLAGRVVSGENAKFTDALLITLIGNILNVILLTVFTIFVAPLLLPLGLLGTLLVTILPWIIVLFVYIWLVMRFFDTGILGAIAVGLIVIVISIIIGIAMIIVGVILLVLLGLFP